MICKNMLVFHVIPNVLKKDLRHCTYWKANEFTLCFTFRLTACTAGPGN